MDPKNKKYIQEYIDGSLSADEKLNFEARMEEDPDFKIDFLLYKSVHIDIKTMSRVEDVLNDPFLDEAFSQAEEAILDIENDPKSVLAEVSAPNENQNTIEQFPGFAIRKPIARSRIYIYLSMAAAISLFVIFGRALFFDINPNQLFNKFYTIPELPLDVSRGGESNSKNEIIRAYNFYKQGETAKAEAELLAIESEMKDYSIFWLLKGLIDMEKGEYQQAIENMNTELNNDDPLYFEKLWFISLCQLKLGSIEESKTSLSSLKKNYNFSEKKIDRLLRDLDRIKKQI